MTYRVNQIVEVSVLHLPCLRWFPALLTLTFNTIQVSGDQNDPGFRDSWSKYKVLTAPRHGRVRVQSLEVWLVCNVHFCQMLWWCPSVCDSVLQFLAEDATNGELLVEVKQLSEVRPCLEDDSQLVPLIARHCGEGLAVLCCLAQGNKQVNLMGDCALGDAVDVEKDGCGRVGQCYGDHITVIFPSEIFIGQRDMSQPNLFKNIKFFQNLTLLHTSKVA